jgi:bifunctional DNA-binding transcriptional regulator/antitoxin component of YhaV-PrlF toxin-antitoxin module
MRVTVSVDESKRLVVPAEFESRLKLEPGTSLVIDVLEVSDAKPHVFDQAKFDAGIAKYAGSMRERMLADGYNSVDELMADLRPEW